MPGLCDCFLVSEKWGPPLQWAPSLSVAGSSRCGFEDSIREGSVQRGVSTDRSTSPAGPLLGVSGPYGPSGTASAHACDFSTGVPRGSVSYTVPEERTSMISHDGEPCRNTNHKPAGCQRVRPGLCDYFLVSENGQRCSAARPVRVPPAGAQVLDHRAGREFPISWRCRRGALRPPPTWPWHSRRSALALRAISSRENDGLSWRHAPCTSARRIHRPLTTSG